MIDLSHVREDSPPGTARKPDVLGQIGRAGPVADLEGNKLPALAPSRHRPLATQTVAKAATHAGRMAVEAGFEMTAVHGGTRCVLSTEPAWGSAGGR